MLRRLILCCTILLLIAATGAFSQSGLEGNMAPGFNLKDVDGNRVKLADLLAEGPVLLDFWATWCVPCKQAIPHLAKLHETYREQGFQLVTISTDNTRSVGKVRPYVRSQKWDFPVLLDTDNEVLKRYRGNSIPHTVLITTEGMVARVWIGYHPGEEKEIEEEIRKLLEPPGEKSQEEGEESP